MPTAVSSDANDNDNDNNEDDSSDNSTSPEKTGVSLYIDDQAIVASNSDTESDSSSNAESKKARVWRPKDTKGKHKRNVSSSSDSETRPDQERLSDDAALRHVIEQSLANYN